MSASLPFDESFVNGLIHDPTIQPPADAWVSTALLYWDKVATIVPPEAMNDPEASLSSFTLDLFRQLPPG